MFRLRSTLVGSLFGATILILVSSNVWAFRLISFDGKPARWDKDHISYVLDQRGSKNFKNGCDTKGPCVSEREAIEISFQSWSQASGVQVDFEEETSKIITKTGYNKENSITWVEKGWTSQSFTPPTGALAVTISSYKTSNNEILDSDIFFNGEYFKWGVIDTQEEEVSDVVDIQNIATHEIGHFIGLDHSSEDIYEPESKLYLATMFFASGPGETFRRILKKDDLDAARNLYPHDHYAAPKVASISPNTIDVTDDSSGNVRIVGENFLPFTTVVLASRDEQGDIAPHVTSVSENEIQLAFDSESLRLGEYDVVVANTYNSSDRIEKGLAVLGGSAPTGNSPYDPRNSDSGYSSSTKTGGCSLAVSDNGKDSLATAILVFLLPLMLYIWTRLHLLEDKNRNTTYAGKND